MMGVPQKKIATVIVANLKGQRDPVPSFVEDRGGKKTLTSYKSNEKPESDHTAAKRDAASRIMRAFKSDDAVGLAEALTDFNALCSYEGEEEDGESDANRTVKEGFGY